MREGTLRTLNAFAKELGSEPVLVRAGNETIAELFKNLSQKIAAENLERLQELSDEWEHHGDDHGEAIFRTCNWKLTGQSFSNYTSKIPPWSRPRFLPPVPVVLSLDTCLPAGNCDSGLTSLGCGVEKKPSVQ